MEDIVLKIIIKHLPNDQFKVQTEFPEAAKVSVISSQLEVIFNQLNNKAADKLNDIGFRSKQDAIDYAYNITIKDLM